MHSNYGFPSLKKIIKNTFKKPSNSSQKRMGIKITLMLIDKCYFKALFWYFLSSLFCTKALFSNIHLGYINTGEHFNLPGHSIRVEKVISTDPEYRKERESHLVRKFNTF